MISDKLKKIYKIKNFDYLIQENQNTDKVFEYYNTNKLAYRIFHNRGAFLHMAISDDDKYCKADLLKQAKYISEYIKNSRATKVLELGYGRGANLYYLSQSFKDVKLFGIDLSTNPLKKYRSKNIIYKRKNFQDLKSYNDTFDLIYAIETICHSDNLEILFNNINSSLTSEGYLIVFDGYYLVDKNTLGEDLKIACTLTEKGMAVNQFHNLDNFKKLAQKNSLTLKKEINLSDNIKPSLYKLQKIAKLYIKLPVLAKMINYFFPEIFIRNFLAGYLMPDLVDNNVAGYYMHVFQKE